MNINMNTPLGSLLDRLLKGEDGDISEEELYSYFENMAHGDKKVLSQALTDTEVAINNWKLSYFISVYEKEVESNHRGISIRSQQELDDLFYGEECLIKEGKTGLTADYLYDAIAKYGFINGHQKDAVDMAWINNDIEFLQKVWEDSALAQIKSVQTIITCMLTTASEELVNDVQNANRPLKRIEDYPEVFDINTCSTLTGYKKNTLYKFTSTDTIPCFHAGNNGRKLMFKRDEVIEWMTAQRQETTEEFINRMDGALASKLFL